LPRCDLQLVTVNIGFVWWVSRVATFDGCRGRTWTCNFSGKKGT
jgi:hypothetical protein